MFNFRAVVAVVCKEVTIKPPKVVETQAEPSSKVALAPKVEAKVEDKVVAEVAGILVVCFVFGTTMISLIPPLNAITVI